MWAIYFTTRQFELPPALPQPVPASGLSPHAKNFWVTAALAVAPL